MIKSKQLLTSPLWFRYSLKDYNELMSVIKKVHTIAFNTTKPAIVHVEIPVPTFTAFTSGGIRHLQCVYTRRNQNSSVKHILVNGKEL